MTFYNMINLVFIVYWDDEMIYYVVSFSTDFNAKEKKDRPNAARNPNDGLGQYCQICWAWRMAITL